MISPSDSPGCSTCGSGSASGFHFDGGPLADPSIEEGPAAEEGELTRGCGRAILCLGRRISWTELPDAAFRADGCGDRFVFGRITAG